MKQVAVWKVALLTLITGGLYAIFWAGRNRDYLAKDTQPSQKLPRWIWLLFIPILFGLGFVAMFFIFFAGYSGALSAGTTSVWVMSVATITTVLVVALGLWWLWYFGKAFEIATQGRMGRAASLLLYVFVGPFVIAFQQYYINRLSLNKKGETYKTGSGLWLLVCIAGVLSVLSLILSMYSGIDELNKIEVEVLQTQTQQQEVDRLERKYMACIENLNTTYPDEYVEPEEEAAYTEAYDECDAIYKEYESAYSAFMGEEPKPSPERV